MALYKVEYTKVINSVPIEYSLVVSAADSKAAFDSASTTLGFANPNTAQDRITNVASISSSGAADYSVTYWYNSILLLLVVNASDELDAYNKAQTAIDALPSQDDKGICAITKSI